MKLACAVATTTLVHVILFATLFTALGRDSLVEEVVSGGSAKDIQDAVTRLPAGGVLTLTSGATLQTPVQIRQPLTVRGSDGTQPIILKCTSEDSAFTISSGNVTLENLIIEQCSTPAVALRHPDVIENTISPVNFTLLHFQLKRVQFKDNGDTFSPGVGGALFISVGWNVDIAESQFINNRATVAGAVYAEGSNLIVKNSTFNGNSALLKAGAISTQSLANALSPKSKIEIFDSIFTQNSNSQVGEGAAVAGKRDNFVLIENNRYVKVQDPAASGGAVYAGGLESVKIENCTFDANKAVSAGGAAYISGVKFVDISLTQFVSNEAQENHLAFTPDGLRHGGAVYLVGTIPGTARIADCVFFGNRGGYGGAVHVLGVPEFKVGFLGCGFEKNEGSDGGGAVILRGVRDVEWERTVVKHNVAKNGGGLLIINGASAFLDSSKRNENERNVFEENYATTGGAIQLFGAGYVTIHRAKFVGNWARGLGGALSAFEGLVDSEVVITSSTFKKNSAGQGGAIGINGHSSVLIRGARGMNGNENSEFVANIALDGGAIFYYGGNHVGNLFEVYATTFEGNLAHGNLSRLVRNIEEGSQHFKGVLEENYRTDGMLATDDLASFLSPGGEPYDSGCGGAICVGLLNSPIKGISMSVSVDSSLFQRNKASLGGAMMVVSGDGEWQPNCSLSSAWKSEVPCQAMTLSNLLFDSNHATGAGGAIFAPDMRRIHIAQNSTSEMTQLAQIMLQELTSSGFDKNTVSDGAFGKDVASDIATIKFMLERPVPMKHVSGKLLPAVDVEVLDWHGQRITAGIPSAYGVLGAQSEAVVGASMIRSKRGRATFDNLQTIAAPGEYNITFISATAADVTPAEVKLVVRDCRPGEEKHPLLCTECSEGFYSHSPEVFCRPCPKEAFCPGGVAVIPKDGYWHSTPFSLQFHECLVKEACSYIHNDIRRNESLSTFFKTEGIRPHPSVVPQELYQQCFEGYEGVLCGSCAVGYGKKQAECRKCAEPRVTRFYIVCVALWSLVLLGVTIRNAVISFQEMEQVKSFWKQERNLQIIGEHAGGPNQATPPGFQYQQPQDVAGLSSELLGSKKINDMIYSALFAPKNMSKASSVQQVNSAETSGQCLRQLPNWKQSQELGVIRHVIAAENLSETVKIWTNYLQVTSLAADINSNWTKTVLSLFATQDLLAGFSSADALVSAECAMPVDSALRVSIGGSLTRMLMPAALFAFVASIFIFVWLKNRSKGYEASSLLSARLTVTLVAVLFFSYMKLSKEFMQSLKCLHLDEYHPSDPGTKYAVAKGNYWAQDTSLECFQGQHNLVAIMGLVGLAILTLGAPLYLLCLLLWLRARDQVFDSINIQRFGFLYQAYGLGTIYWEVVILLRKALIVSVVVFARTLGAHLQTVLALGVLNVALIAHMLLRPFKYSHLNHLETASLSVSILTVYSGLFFQDSNTSHTTRVAITVAVLMSNIAVFTLLVGRAFLQFDRYSESKLIAYGRSIPRNHLCKYIKFVTFFVLTSLPPATQARLNRKMTAMNERVPSWVHTWFKDDSSTGGVGNLGSQESRRQETA